MEPIGLRLPNADYGYSTDDVIDLAQRIEGYGYHSVWAAEAQARNAFMVLAQLAAATDEIRLGTGIVNVYSRTPALLAMSAATLDEMSGGRAILGLAPSSRVLIERLHGVEYDRPLDRVREAAEIVDAAMRGERIDYDGEVFAVRNYPRGFDPVREHVPVFNAALGKRNRELTGEFADGWLPVYVPREKFPEFIDDVHAGAERAGRDPDAVTVAPYVTACVAGDRDRARQRAAETLAYYVGVMDYYADVFRGFGFGDEVEVVRAAWNGGTREEAGAAVPDSLLDAVAVTGTPEEGREQLREYRDLGVDLPILQIPATAARETIETTIRELAP